MDFFATAAKGTEGALRDELRELRFKAVRADRGGVHFVGEWKEGYRACLFSRVAMRILGHVGRVPARDGASLYDGVAALDFSPHLTPQTTLAVRAAGRSPGLVHTQFVAQKTKDALVDGIREKTGARPSVDLEDPDVEVFVHVRKEGEADVYLDLAGEVLHRRSYRTRIGTAPLKETLAAAILRLSGWDRRGPLVDPMCGSGTFLVEGAQWARAMAPGLLRRRFGFERWASHDDTRKAEMADLREEAKRKSLPPEGAPSITGSDVDEALLDAARANGNAAGVRFELTQRSVETAPPPAAGGILVTNPPYGERLGRGEPLGGPGGVYRKLATVARRTVDGGATVAVLSGTPELEDVFYEAGLRRTRWLALWNGDIECRLLVYAPSP